MEGLNGEVGALLEELAVLRARVAELEQWNGAAERAAEALSRSDQSLRRVFDHSNDGIFIVDPTADRIVDVNQRACTMLGYTREEILARPMSCVHPDDSPKLDAFTEQVLAEGAGWTRELSCVTKSGVRIPSEISASVLESGANRYVIALVRDISERKRAEEELLRANRRMRADLDAAAEVQESLLPAPTIEIPGLEVGWQVRPSERLGGDLLDLYRVDDEHVGMYVVDVSGHGVSAAMLSIAIQRVLSQSAVEAPMFNGYRGSNPDAGGGLTRPSEVCRRLNTMFPRNPITGQYCTLIYGVYNLRTHVFRFSSAGHSPPILVTPDGRAQELVLPGAPIGLWPDSEFEEMEVAVPPGSRIYLYSDGILDVFGPEGDPYGVERLLGEATELRGHDVRTCVTRLIEGALAWNAGLVPLDDISLLAFEAGIRVD